MILRMTFLIFPKGAGGRLLRKITFLGWGLLSGEDTDEGRGRLILACESFLCGVELNGTSTFLSIPEQMKWKSSAALNIFLPQDWKTLLDTRLDSTMFRPISDNFLLMFCRLASRSQKFKQILCGNISCTLLKVTKFYLEIDTTQSTKVINALLFGFSSFNWLCRSISPRF